jgi:uncharacterized protein
MSQQDSSTVNKITDNQLEPVVLALQHHIGPDLIAVVLFGSRARGDSYSESDWDLLVIAGPLPDNTLQRHFYLKRMLPPAWAAQVSVLAKTPAELEAYLTGLILDVALDGVVLYDTDKYMTDRLAYLRRLISEKGLYREQVGRDLIWKWQKFPGRDWSIEWDIACFTRESLSNDI